jgi:predicted  nucleic acid-binding Zn-ribbon protein
LRKAVAQNTEILEQCRRDLECMRDEKCAVESQVQTLQSSLASLQASLEMISGQRNTAEVSRKEAQACLDALQTEKGDLEHQTSSLQRQLDTLNTANDALQQKCHKLEQRLMEVETLKNAQAEETLQLKNMVSILKSSQLNKDRKLTELEQRFQSTQREMVEKEVDHRGTERSRSVLEQRLAHFEQSSARQEGTKKELQSRVQYLESQLTEIQEKAQCLRRDVQRLQRENLSLTGDVENLSKCLETTTREKQTLAQSLEMEIERLREEVGRLLHVNSSLKVQLVHNQGSQSPLCMDPAADGLLSASRTQLQSVQMSSSAESCGTSPEECTEDWQGQCFKYRTAVHQLKRKVKYLERKLSATKLSPQPTDSSVQQFSGEGTDTLHHKLVVHSPTTHTDQQVEGDVSPHATSTPSKPSTFS